MRLSDSLAAWVGRTIGRERFEHDMAAEIDFHIETKADELERRGLPRAEALRQARLSFGGRERIKEEGRDVSRYRVLDELHANLRDAVRGLRRDPSFAFVAVAVVASVLAVNMVLFCFLDAYFLRPLPIEGAKRHVELTVRDAQRRSQSSWPLADAMQILSAQSPVLERAYLFSSRRVLVGRSDPLRAYAEVVSPSYFEHLRPRMALGRALRASSGEAVEHAAMLSFSGWKRLTGGDPKALGSTLAVDGVALSVVGVLPEGAGGLEPVTPDLWMLAGAADPARVARRDTYAVGGLLREGVSKDQASAALAPLVRPLSEGNGSKPQELEVRLEPRTTLLRESRELRPLALSLLFLFGLVTVIAAANLTSLHLARATARRRSLAIRAALGASRARLLRHLLTESVLLSALAALLAWGLAVASVAAVQGAVFRLVSDAGMSMQPVRVDGRVLLAGFALAGLVGIGCGLLPALRTTRTDGSIGLRRDGLWFGGRLSAGRLRGALVVLQVALSLPLLVGAGVLVRSAASATRADVGFRLEGLVDLRADQSSARLLDRLRANPKVVGASAVSRTPLAGPTPRVAGMVDGAALSLGINEVDEQFFATTGIALLGGRSFLPAETASLAPVAMISASTARRLWPGRSPLGRTLALEDPDAAGRYRSYEVIGVAEDVMSGFFFEGSDASTVYLPASLQKGSLSEILVRMDEGKASGPAGLRTSCRDLGTYCEPLPMRAVFAQQRVPFSVASLVASGLGLLALSLACLGLYGLVRFAVVQRTREFGVRLSLGATRRRILADVLGEASRRVGLGLACGLPICFGLSKLIASRVPIVEALDPIPYLLVPLLLLGAALVASLAPALRAAATDPNRILREG